MLAPLNLKPLSLVGPLPHALWVQVRKTKKHLSSDPHQSEDMLFFSFAKAVRDPSCSDGKLWSTLQPDVLADLLISEANKTFQDPFHNPNWW